MAKVSLAQNGVIELSMGGRAGAAIMASAASAVATAVFVIEILVDGTWFTPVTTRNPLVNPTVEQANITGPSKVGWLEVFGAERVRVRRTDATGGDGTVSLLVAQNV